MRFAAITLISSLGLAAAQTTSASTSQPTGSSCAAQNIVDACVEGIQKQIDACEGNDWICLCDNYTNKLTCYNNCPDSQERPPVENQVTQFCNAAAPLKSASASAAATQSQPASASQATDSAATATSAEPSSSPTGSDAAASSTPTGAAAAIAAPVGGALAVFLGVAGLL